MSRSADKEAWGGFWSGRDGGSSSCLPEALRQIDMVQRQWWQAFAGRLPKGARVLDVGTGNGVILGKMWTVRRDLKLIGVDSSPSLPPAPAGMILKAGVDMEALPFPDGSFHAAVSQFGFEYSDTARTAKELGRVLRTGGVLQLMVHHRSGPILAHNLPRREALRWASSPDGYLDKARRLVAARALCSLPTPDLFRQAPQEAQRLYPTQPVAAEFVSAILQTLELGRNAPPAEGQQVLQTLEDRANNEIARIDSLERAARDLSAIAHLSDELGAAGLEMAPAQEVFEQGQGRPFAWILTGARQSD